MSLGLRAGESATRPVPLPRQHGAAPLPVIDASQPRLRRLLATLHAYIALTKPRIIELLLVTTIPAMLLAAKGWPGWRLILATTLGGYLAAGGAGAINCYLDRDVDELMVRTRRRPLVTGEISARRALVFGITLGVAAFFEMWLWVNLPSAVLSMAALGFYVFVYTLWLKRSTPQNIVIGGAAGAMPPVIGWAAVTGQLAWAPVVLFLIVFVWTPPHFWALALRFQDDYERAHIPMLPVVRGERETLRQIVMYSAVLVLLSFLLLPTGAVGAVYTVSAASLGAGFLLLAWRLHQQPGQGAAIGLFRYSISYLTLLFMAMAADQVAQNLFGRFW
ncbi:MAG TPA: heme o synthase [Dehalococcoidia bacterium]|nr:heme o synthase [Dehalococcoidia bacterium]